MSGIILSTLHRSHDNPHAYHDDPQLYLRSFPAAVMITLHCTELAFLHRKGGAPLKEIASLRDLPPPKKDLIRSNRRISITKEICITIDFAPPEKLPGRKADEHSLLCS